MRPHTIFSYLAFSLIMCISLSTVGQNRMVKWAVQKNSTLNVKGSSNVNNFSCNVTSLAGYDTIVVMDGPTRPMALKGAISVDVLSFDCHNSLIRKDLRKTLKVEQYPKMVIRFLTLKSMPFLTDRTEHVNGWVEVELAGVKKIFELNYTFRRVAGGCIILKGGRKFCFSDFNLVPPRKLGGLVKIRDDFDVSFELGLIPLG
ncbi:MAG: YceI family protein [Gloeobacteraceae cyanobacterium ES-bin-316]|nr:YceI family protein [Ferruginibacter sp.]